MTAHRLFGTDGIRGRALEPPLDEATVRRVGVALAQELGAPGATPRILLAGDTRVSTATLAGWLSGAFRAAGGKVTWAGVLPTPAVSHLLRRGDWTAGVVISASHNPAPDNGIKVLAATGEKLDDAVEQRLEERMRTAEPATGPPLPTSGYSLGHEYVDLLVATHDRPRPLDGMRLVVDAANGAASGLASELLDRLGARVTTIASDPDGRNINLGCGATAPDGLRRAVLDAGADGGIALDGDADRAVLVDERGRVLDGDDILLAWGRHLAARDRLPGRTVVATVMSNFGLERALERDRIATVRCGVGDRTVWLAMASTSAALGGEQSGHVICAHHSVSGDGLLTGSHLMAIAAGSDRRVSELSDLLRLPQVLLNVPVARKLPFDGLPGVQRELAALQRTLDGRGRVLLRYSGTEPLARVMVEGDDASEIESLAEQLASAIRLELR